MTHFAKRFFGQGIPRNGLIAEYLFSGNALDTSGSNLNGTVYGATLTTDKNNETNSAYLFNGPNNFIKTQPTSLASGDYYTACAWIKKGAFGSENNGVVTLTQTIAPYAGWELYIRRSDGAIGRYRNTHFIYSNVNKVENGVWTFVLIECYRHTTDGYFKISKNNGASETIFFGDTVQAMTVLTNQKLHIGIYNAAHHQYDGAIDSVRMYNRLLNAVEKTGLYNE